jgi:hypothetical protein
MASVFVASTILMAFLLVAVAIAPDVGHEGQDGSTSPGNFSLNLGEVEDFLEGWNFSDLCGEVEACEFSYRR